MYRCLYDTQRREPNYYLNTILQPDQLPRDLWETLETPKLLFYDIETNEYATQDIEDDQNRARINSIAWITEDDQEYILIRGRDGNEQEILNKFVMFCKKHNIMGLVGHNSAGFDNRIMQLRCINCGVRPGNLFYNNCNLDTMVLAQLFQYSAGFISLNDLCILLNVDEGKEIINDNPVTLYNNALQDNELMEQFINYNLQDVRATKECFYKMESIEQLNALFIETLTPFSQMKYNSMLLNGFTCKTALNDNIVIPYDVNKPIEFKNEGGFNYCLNEDKKELQLYNNILVLDVVSYYPHLLMLIGADPVNEYNNINRKTGEIKPFESVPNGYLSKLSGELYDARAKLKNAMKQTEDKDQREILDHQQKTKKIIVNSLYGVLSQRGDYYVLKNELIGATITAIGRDILNHVIKEFNGVYGKTDSVFIPLENKDDAPQLLTAVNKYVSLYIKERYNLENVREKDGERLPLIHFEIDGVLNKLIVKDRNNYIKVFEDGTYKLKGGSFNTVKLSRFEQDLNKEIIKYLINHDTINKDELIKTVNAYTKQSIENTQDIPYYSKIETLSDKEKKLKEATQTARFYMDENDINYFTGFKYLICRVSNYKQDYIMFPKGYNPENVQLNKTYPYELTGNRLFNFNILDSKERDNYNKLHQVRKPKKYDVKQTNLLFDNTQINDFNPWNVDKVKNKKLLELNNIIPDTIQFYNEEKIKFIACLPNQKRPDVLKGTKYDHEYIKQHPQKFDVNKFKSNYNIGLVRGINNLKVLDIDGRKYLGYKLNKLLKEWLYKTISKNVNYPFIIQETQSEGYHLLYYSETEQVNNTLGNIYFPLERPQDFPQEITKEIYNKKLAGQSFGASTIELFNDLNGFIVFAPSTIDDGNNKGEYKILNNGCTWSQIFNNPINDIREQIESAFKSAGFIVKEATATPGHNPDTNFKRNEFLKRFEGNELNELTNLTIDLFKLVDVYNAKHYTALYLGGYYSNKLSLTNAETIAEQVIKQIGDIMDDTDAFKRDFLGNYERDIHKKTLSGINEHTQNDDEVTNILIKIRDIVEGKTSDNDNGAIIDIDDNGQINITSETETITNPNSNETKQKTDTLPGVNADKVFNYSNKSNNSFLTARTNILYAISPAHYNKLKYAVKDLLNEFKEKDRIHIKRLIYGGFAHFKIPPVYEIPGYDPIRIYNENEVYTIGNENKIYGFPKITEIINGRETLEINDDKGKTTKINFITDMENNEDKQSAKQKRLSGLLKQIKNIINEITILNPTYYVCQGYRQQNNELYTNSKSKIGYFAFKDIKKIDMYNPANPPTPDNQKYNFTLVNALNGQIIEKENVTMEELTNDLFNRKLIIGSQKNPHLTDIIKFVNETEKKQGLNKITLPVAPGFYYKDNKIISYFPDISNKYTLREGVETLNDIYKNVFNNKTKYGAIYWLEFIQILCNVYKNLNLAQVVNRHLLALGYRGAFKTTACNMIKYTFEKIQRFEESDEGDTVPAIARNMNKSSIPMINDDPAININSQDFKNLMKNTAYGYSANVQAQEQYGNETNRRDAFRLINTTHNDTNFIIDRQGGEQRRVNIIIFTEDDEPTPEQLDAINRVTSILNGEMAINKLNAIGCEYIEFIKKYFGSWNQEKQNAIKNSFGWCIIDEFIKHLETQTGVTLCDGLKTKNYKFDDLTEDETLIIYDRLRYNYEKTLKNNGVTISYDKDTIDIFANLCNWITPAKDKRYSDGDTKYYIRQNEFLQLIKSPAVLGRRVEPKEIIKMLDLPREFNRKRNASKGGNDIKKPLAMELTAEEIKTYLFNEIEIIEDT